MTLAVDPVAEGFVDSLARPGRNVTGLTSLVPGLSQKYVELLREVVPSATRFAVVAMPPNPIPQIRRELEAAAKGFGMTVFIAQPSGPEEFDRVVSRAKRHTPIAIRLPQHLVQTLKIVAKSEGEFEYQAMVRRWIQERLQQETSTRR
jgi:ABC-type uncharacterized transport system substrate-binding protein